MQVTVNSKSVVVSIWARALDGTPVLGKVAADFVLTYRRDGDSIPIDLSDLSDLSVDWEVGGIFEVGNGEYRLDMPDEAFLSDATQVTVNGTVTDGVILGYPIGLASPPIDEEELIRTILAAIVRNMSNIEVRPERPVLGPCDRPEPSSSVFEPIPRSVVPARGPCATN